MLWVQQLISDWEFFIIPEYGFYKFHLPVLIGLFHFNLNPALSPRIESMELILIDGRLLMLFVSIITSSKARNACIYVWKKTRCVNPVNSCIIHAMRVLGNCYLWMGYLVLVFMQNSSKAHSDMALCAAVPSGASWPCHPLSVPWIIFAASVWVSPSSLRSFFSWLGVIGIKGECIKDLQSACM